MADQAGPNATAGEVPGTEATPAMGDALAGGAASVQDVIAQDEGQPTAAEQADQATGSSQVATSENTEGQTVNTQTGETTGDQLAAAEPGQTAAGGGSDQFTSGGNNVDMNQILLTRAEAYSSLGNEDACMNVIDQIQAQQ
jgi:hypothetical protein